MSSQTVIQFRRGSAYLWKSVNPVLAEGEAGFEIDTGRLKIGDGYNNWNDLQYIGSGEVIQTVINTNAYTIQKGQAVYFKEIYNGQINIDQYNSNNTDKKYKFLGLVTSNLGQNNIGTVLCYGRLTGLDTRGTRISSISVGGEVWSPGTMLYVHASQPGKLTSIEPKNSVLIGSVGVVDSNNGSIFVKSYVQSNLFELNDTNITVENLDSNKLLKYNSDLDSWEPSNIIDGGVI